MFLNKLRKSTLVRDSGTYTILNFTEKAIPFLILPILTRVLSKDDIGYFILYQSIVEIIIPMMTFNIDSSILINYYKLENKRFSVYFSNGIFLFIIIYPLILILFNVFSTQISNLISFPEYWLNAVYLIVFFMFLTNLRQHIWRIKHKIIYYAFFTIGISLFRNGIGLIFVFNTFLGWKGLILGNLIGYGIFSILAVITFFKFGLIKFEKSIPFIRDCLKTGLPLSIHKLGIWLGNAANKIIIISILGAAATGSYGIGATFATIITLVEDAFNKAFQPYLYEQLTNINDSKRIGLVKLTFYVYAFIISISILSFIFGVVMVDVIFGSQYIDTKGFILPLVLAAMFKGLYKLHVNYIIFTKKTILVTKITISTGILNIILAYLFIKNFGLVGAAYSLLIINLIQYVLMFIEGNKQYPLPWLSFIRKQK